MLRAQQHDPQFLDRFVETAPEVNDGIWTIHDQLVARREELQTTDFLREPATIAHRLLSAYLQPSCWYAAQHFYSTKIAPSNLSHEYSLEDCFQIAAENATQSTKILQNFQIGRKNTTIRTYAEKTLEKMLARIIQLNTMRNDSTWKLLRYLSQKELTAALQADGYTNSKMAQSCLIWRCFKEIYQTRQVQQNQLPPPTELQLQEMHDRYRQRCKPYGITTAISAESILPNLEAIAQAVRQYRSSDAVLDRLLQETHHTTDGLADLMRVEQVTQIGTIVAQSFAELPEVAQIMLNLWFGLELSHAEILRLLKPELKLEKQYQLSRQIKRYKKTLVLLLIQKIGCPKL
ncbi:MAG: hypothetical protein HC936_07175 [Leptolyngbyaceae cyanobacterium SU_3_3]|nr:hypothetical protein [Leptolyngbyaceae cyanobacterium SU_3_3]